MKRTFSKQEILDYVKKHDLEVCEELEEEIDELLDGDEELTLYRLIHLQSMNYPEIERMMVESGDWELTEFLYSQWAGGLMDALKSLLPEGEEYERTCDRYRIFCERFKKLDPKHKDKQTII